MLCNLFRIHIIQVVLNELHTSREICLVEFVWDVPAKRTKLAPFLRKKNLSIKRYLVLVTVEPG